MDLRTVITLCLKEMQLRGAWITGGRPSPYRSTGIAGEKRQDLTGAKAKAIGMAIASMGNSRSVTQAMTIYWSREI
jgi:hypothetical protein